MGDGGPLVLRSRSAHVATALAQQFDPAARSLAPNFKPDG